MLLRRMRALETLAAYQLKALSEEARPRVFQALGTLCLEALAGYQDKDFETAATP